MAEINKWNVIFLVNKNPATKVILLHRSPNKTYAPNFYTGIGGKIGDLPGLENETPLESAYRELYEETENQLSKKNCKLQEFARCVYEDERRLYYFWGLYNEDNPPHADPKDGKLTWVTTQELLSKDIIPTTMAMCREWANRKFSLEDPFTICIKDLGLERTVRLVKVINISDGLK